MGALREDIINKKEEIIDSYIKGEFTPVELSKKLNCSYGTIYKLLKDIKKHKFPGKNTWSLLNLPELQIVDLYKKDVSVPKISKIYKCSNYSIYKILYKNKIELKGNKGKPSGRKLKLDEKEIIDLYKNKNFSSIQIAKMFNCDYSVITGILKNNGIIIKGTEFFLKGKHNSPETEFKKGDIPTFETRKKRSASQQGIPLEKWEKFTRFEPYTELFNKAFKLAIKQRDGFMCLKCGMREEDHLKLFKAKEHIHHIDYIKENTFFENCCLLCRRCNLEVNSDREIWTKHFQALLSKRYGYQYSENGEIIVEVKI